MSYREHIPSGFTLHWLALTVVMATTALAGEDTSPRLRPVPPSAEKSGRIEILLVAENDSQPRSKTTGEVVSFGVPFGPGVLDDDQRLRVLDAQNREYPVFTKELVRWRIDNKLSSIRSVLVQFADQIPPGQEKKVFLEYGISPKKRLLEPVPVEATLQESSGAKGPRVWAVLPAKWMCDSWIAGPQMPAAENKILPDYETCAARSFEAQLPDMTSTEFEAWLFDRTSAIYRMYVRTGELKYLKAAYHCANFVRGLSDEQGRFTIRDKFMYVYPRAQALHYMFTGDARALDMLRRQAKYFDTTSTEALITYVPGPQMWTERMATYSWAGLIYSFEGLGQGSRWDRLRNYGDVLYGHQANPPDGKPADGSWRHRWVQHDAVEGDYAGGSSVWMTGLMYDPMFEYWLLTGDERVAEMVTRYCEFLLKKGLNAQGSQAYYVVDCFGPSKDSGGMESRNMELSYMLAMGLYFSKDPNQQARFKEAFVRLYRLACTQTYTSPKRSFNWAFQNSSVMPWLIANSAAPLTVDATSPTTRTAPAQQGANAGKANIPE